MRGQREGGRLTQGCCGTQSAAGDRGHPHLYGDSEGARPHARCGTQAQHHRMHERRCVQMRLAAGRRMDGMQPKVRAAFRRRPEACHIALRLPSCIPMQSQAQSWVEAMEPESKV